jgi:Uma2 family endonuclease
MTPDTPIVVDPNTIVYPETDGQPMAENTLQFQWIVTIHGHLEAQFRNEDVFVAGDLFWYPVQGDNRIRMAPDVLVALGRPRGHRNTYLQWLEGGIAPQVVFEIRAPSNTDAEMAGKLEFYDTYRVEEYYLYDPFTNHLEGWLRGAGGSLHPVARMNGWRSPRLCIRFDLSGPELLLYRRTGEVFRTYLELFEDRRNEQKKAEQARQHAEQPRQHAEQAKRALKEAHEQIRRLEERLRALEIDPDQPV